MMNSYSFPSGRNEVHIFLCHPDRHCAGPASLRSQRAVQVRRSVYQSDFEPRYISTGFAIPAPGISTSESGAGSQTYIVSHRDTKNVVETFVTRSGARRWMIGNGENPDAVMLTLAGLWTTGTLLPGNMIVLRETAVNQQLMRWFLSALKQEQFARTWRWWLGRESLHLLRQGRRLSTTAEQSPPDFDLKPPEALRG